MTELVKIKVHDEDSMTMPIISADLIEFAEQTAAATKIQAIFRGKQIRKQQLIPPHLVHHHSGHHHHPHHPHHGHHPGHMHGHGHHHDHPDHHRHGHHHHSKMNSRRHSRASGRESGHLHSRAHSGMMSRDHSTHSRIHSRAHSRAHSSNSRRPSQVNTGRGSEHLTVEMDVGTLMNAFGAVGAAVTPKPEQKVTPRQSDGKSPKSDSKIHSPVKRKSEKAHPKQEVKIEIMKQTTATEIKGKDVILKVEPNEPEEPKGGCMTCALWIYLFLGFAIIVLGLGLISFAHAMTSKTSAPAAAQQAVADVYESSESSDYDLGY